MKKILSFIVGLLLLATIPLTYYAFHHHHASKQVEAKPIHKNAASPNIAAGLKLFTPEQINSATVDIYFLLTKVQDKTHTFPQDDIEYMKNLHKNNPYKRTANKNDPLETLKIGPKKNTSSKTDYYQILGTNDTFTGWDGLLLKALYCDKTGYNDADFSLLSKTLKKKDGSYNDTHYLLALLFLQGNHCYRNDVIRQEIAQIATTINAAEAKDKEFSDLYVERIVMLYWSGHGDLVKKDWITKIDKSFKTKVGWSDDEDFNAHTTALSLLALLYWKENKPYQPVY